VHARLEVLGVEPARLEGVEGMLGRGLDDFSADDDRAGLGVGVDVNHADRVAGRGAGRLVVGEDVIPDPE
jgi:hypothetical protein